MRLTEHKQATRNGDANNHIAVHHQLTNHNIDWDPAQCLTYSTNYFQWLTLESWYTNLEETPLNRFQQLPAPYKRLIHDRNETYKRTSNRPTYKDRKLTYLTNNRWIETHLWLMTNFTWVFQPIPSWLYWPRHSMDQTYNIIDWQTLFTWLWRWLPLRLSKCQSPTTVLFRTTLTKTITLYELLILLGSNHLLRNRDVLKCFISGEITCLAFIHIVKGSHFACRRSTSPLVSELRLHFSSYM